MSWKIPLPCLESLLLKSGTRRQIVAREDDHIRLVFKESIPVQSFYKDESVQRRKRVKIVFEVEQDEEKKNSIECEGENNDFFDVLLEGPLVTSLS